MDILSTAWRFFVVLRFYNVEVLSTVLWRFYGSTDLRVEVLSTALRFYDVEALKTSTRKKEELNEN